MNNAFSQYVSEQAFVLALSKPMIEALAWFGSKKRDEYPAVPYFVSLNALMRRGLVAAGKGPEGRKPHITEEGRMVLELCKRAGLVPEALLEEAA